MRDFVLTSESMTRGHPDKLCDQISDAAVDACLSSDPAGGIVAECAAASGVLFLSIRHRRELAFDPTALARRVIAEVGAQGDFAQRAAIMLDLAAAPGLPGPAEARACGASHMTTAFGHACDHTPERIPFAIWACHRLAARLDARRAEGALPWLGADAQVQIAARFEDRRPVAVEALALTFALGEAAAPEEEALRAALWEEAIAPVFEGAAVAPEPDLRIALAAMPGPGGPQAHSGLTGRKTAADSYGAFARHSSSALSGKDPGRTERLAAYAARQAAATVLAAGLARECEVQLSYAPGDAAPSGLEVDTFGTGALSDQKLSKRLGKTIDFRIAAIQERLDLWALPAARGGRFFQDCAVYGHFGRPDLDPPWERTPDADRLA